MIALLSLALFLFTNGLIIDGNRFTENYLTFGLLPQSTFKGNATFSQPIDICSKPFNEISTSDIQGKILIVGYKVDASYHRYCLLNVLAKKMNSTGAVAIVAMLGVDNEFFNNVDSISADTLSDENELITSVYDPSVRIPVVQVSQKVGQQIIKLMKGGATEITLEPVTMSNRNEIRWMQSMYITNRVYGSVAFFIVAVISSIHFGFLIRRKYCYKVPVSTPPVILLLEIIIASTARSLQHLIDPAGVLGIVPYYVVSIAGYINVLLISIFVLLLFFWISAVTTSYSVPYKGLLPRVALYVFIAINIFLITGQTLTIFSTNRIVYNAIVAVIVLLLSMGYIIVCVKFLRALKHARDIKSLVLKKMTFFVLATTIIAVIMIPSVISFSLYPKYQTAISFLIRNLECTLLGLVISLVYDKRIQNNGSDPKIEATDSKHSTTLQVVEEGK